jgi:hypothetical protein
VAVSVSKSSAILTTYCFKRLAILSLREVAVLLRNRVDQIGIGDKETRKNNKQYNMRAIIPHRPLSG